MLTEIDHRFGTNPAFGNDFDIGWYEPDYIDNLADACAVGARRRVEVAEWLGARTPDWRLFLTCMSEVHSVGHHYWHGVDGSHPLYGVASTSELAASRFVEVCQAVDSAVGRFAAALPPDAALVVFALHGMKPADDVPATVLLPELAHRLHFGRSLLRDPDHPAWAKAGYPPVVPARHEVWQGYMKARFSDGVGDDLRHCLRRAPAPIYDMARRITGRTGATSVGPLRTTTPPEYHFDQLGPPRGSEGLEYQVGTWYRRHWPRMRWFVVPTFADTHVRLNVGGREGGGVVHHNDYRRARDETVAAISRCRDPPYRTAGGRRHRVPPRRRPTGPGRPRRRHAGRVGPRGAGRHRAPRRGDRGALPPRPHGEPQLQRVRADHRSRGTGRSRPGPTFGL